MCFLYVWRPGVITMQALSEDDRRLWMEAMDGREPVGCHGYQFALMWQRRAVDRQTRRERDSMFSTQSKSTLHILIKAFCSVRFHISASLHDSSSNYKKKAICNNSCRLFHSVSPMFGLISLLNFNPKASVFRPFMSRRFSTNMWKTYKLEHAA